jgi:S-adenosylmethionine hydrolase
MAIITLTSDLGTSDHYLAVVKGRLLSAIPEAKIVDLTHDIPKYDLFRTSFILKQTWHHFPPQTIHIVGVEALETEDYSLIAVLLGGHYFIGADNGVFSMLSEELPQEIVKLQLSPNQKLSPFPMLDVFVPAACHLAEGGALKDLGTARKELRDNHLTRPFYNDACLTATVLFIDSFGNLVTNVDEALFKKFVNDRPFRIAIPGKREDVVKISRSYSEGSDGSALALFGFTGLLEVAVAQGSAARLMGMKVNDPIRVLIDD